MAEEINQISRSPEEINQILREIHDQLKRDKTTAKDVVFRVQLKSIKDSWEMVLQYKGPDPETTRLLQANRAQWTEHPELFVNMMNTMPQISHPVVHAAYHCVRLSQAGAWVEMVRRCFCILFSQLQKQYRMAADTVAQQICRLDPTLQVPDTYVSQLQDAGSRYESLEAELGEGITFVLGNVYPRQLWELRIPKKGLQREEAIRYLQSIGIEKLAAENKALRTAVFNYLFWQVANLTQPPSSETEYRTWCIPCQTPC